MVAADFLKCAIHSTDREFALVAVREEPAAHAVQRRKRTTSRLAWNGHSNAVFQAGLRTPALDPVSRWRVEEGRDLARQFTQVEQRVGTVYVRKASCRPATG
jgi:hypothetical protein